ncbi:hypothetical protein MGN70_000458 [Eutypa lata]|nr:hypothetical protein MGN70_000458 [Eutypa lata]
MSTLKLYVAICKEHSPGGARHWILMLAPEGAERGTWYHVTGGPTQNKPYKLEIQTKRINSTGVETHHHVGNIAQKDVNKVKSSAQKIAPKFCQGWAVDVLGDLEKKSLVPRGTHNGWSQQMEVDPYSNDGATNTSSSHAESSSAAVGVSAAPVGETTSTTTTAQVSGAATQPQPEWVWDQAAGMHRYWDNVTQQWVWQS